MKKVLFTAMTLFVFTGLSSQHLSLNAGMHESPFNPRGDFPSINTGIEYEQFILSWFSLSTGAVFSISLRTDDADYCYSPEWLDGCPDSFSGNFRMIEFPFLAHFQLISDEENISSLNLLVGYGYGLTLGHYEEIQFTDQTFTDGKIVRLEIDNPHIVSAGLEFRHYLSETITFSLGCRYRYLTNVSGQEFDGMDLNHFLFYLRFGLDFRKFD